MISTFFRGSSSIMGSHSRNPISPSPRSSYQLLFWFTCCRRFGVGFSIPARPRGVRRPTFATGGPPYVVMGFMKNITFLNMTHFSIISYSEHSCAINVRGARSEGIRRKSTHFSFHSDQVFSRFPTSSVGKNIIRSPFCMKKLFTRARLCQGHQWSTSLLCWEHTKVNSSLRFHPPCRLLILVSFFAHSSF
jgi:hypothetical protein